MIFKYIYLERKSSPFILQGGNVILKMHIISVCYSLHRVKKTGIKFVCVWEIKSALRLHHEGQHDINTLV